MTANTTQIFSIKNAAKKIKIAMSYTLAFILIFAAMPTNALAAWTYGTTIVMRAENYLAVEGLKLSASVAENRAEGYADLTLTVDTNLGIFAIGANIVFNSHEAAVMSVTSHELEGFHLDKSLIDSHGNRDLLMFAAGVKMENADEPSFAAGDFATVRFDIANLGENEFDIFLIDLHAFLPCENGGEMIFVSAFCDIYVSILDEDAALTPVSKEASKNIMLEMLNDDGFFSVTIDDYSIGEFAPGEIVHINAQRPSDNHVFDRWNGTEISISNTHNTFFIMPANNVVLTPVWRQFQTHLGDVTGDGILCDDDISALSRYLRATNSEMFLVAHPNFRPANADTNADGKIERSDLTLLRLFAEQNRHYLTILHDGGGRIIHGTSGYYVANSIIELEAEANEGYVFIGWEASGGGYFLFAENMPFNDFQMPFNPTTVTARFMPLCETDSDGDGLPDWFEISIDTDPNNPDTDGDGLPDGFEILSARTDPLHRDSFGDGVNDSDRDFDYDGLTNLEEFLLGTCPWTADTDGDGLTDYEETRVFFTDPLNHDTDNDGVLDGDEILLGLNPNNPITDGITPDALRTFNQTLPERNIDPSLRDSGNRFVPSISGNAQGAISRNVWLDESWLRVFDEHDALISPVVEVVTEQTTPFTMTFTSTTPLDSYDGNLESLFVMFWDGENLHPLPTTVNPATNTIEATIPGAGVFFVADLEKFLTDILVEDIQGMADIVFVFDTTGSMGPFRAGTVNNIGIFAERLVNEYNIDARFALVDFKDIIYDGINSTRVIRNGDSNWFTDVQQYRAALNSLIISGGGDAPETPIDALEMARRLDFRPNATQFIILVTDINYRVDNRFGITSMGEMAGLLAADGIITSVIVPAHFRHLYSILYQSTGGVFADINTNFNAVLMDLADMIGEATDGYWIRLDNFQAVRLDGSPEEGHDTDGDGLLDKNELGESFEMDLAHFVEALMNAHGVSPESDIMPMGSNIAPHGGGVDWGNFSNTNVTLWTHTSNPAIADTDGDGIPDYRDPFPLRPADARFKFADNADYRPTNSEVDNKQIVSEGRYAQESVTWNREDWGLRARLIGIQSRAWANVAAGPALNMPHAAIGLAHFLRGSGNPLSVSLRPMIATDFGRTHFNINMNAFLMAGEQMVMDGNTETIATIDQGYRDNRFWAYRGVWDGGDLRDMRGGILPTLSNDADWMNFVNDATAAIVGVVTRNGDYFTAAINYFMDDMYDWEPNSPLTGGLVADGEMAELHWYGWAREYRVDGHLKGIEISWRRGQRFSYPPSDNEPAVTFP